MQYTNLLKAIPMSFYSKKLYGEIGQKWRGRGILYMLVLLSILWMIGSALFLENAVDRVGQLVSVIAPQMPTLIFKEGTVQTPKNKTVFINDQHDHPIVLINTAGTFKGDFQSHPAIAMITQDALWIKYSSVETEKMEVYHFPKTWNGKVDAITIKNFYERIKAQRYLILYPVLFVVGLAISFVCRMMSALIYAVVGLIFSRMNKGHLTYAALINLSLVMMTPALLVRFAMLVSNVLMTTIIYWGLLILNIVYLYLAVKWSIRKHPTSE